MAARIGHALPNVNGRVLPLNAEAAEERAEAAENRSK
jgi:hypothetical protein